METGRRQISEFLACLLACLLLEGLGSSSVVLDLLNGLYIHFTLTFYPAVVGTLVLAFHRRTIGAGLRTDRMGVPLLWLRMVSGLGFGLSLDQDQAFNRRCCGIRNRIGVGMNVVSCFLWIHCTSVSCVFFWYKIEFSPKDDTSG